MSAFSDKIGILTSHVDATTARVLGDVAGLKAQIADLQAKVDAGGASPDDLAALDALVAKVDAIDPTTPSVVPVPEPVPAPA